jgi:hypothetical protein
VSDPQPLSISRRAPNPNIIEKLEKALQRAKDGQVFGVVIIEDMPAGDVNVVYDIGDHGSHHNLRSGCAIYTAMSIVEIMKTRGEL